MSERWSLTIVKANRVSPLGYILSIPLVICWSEIIASDSSSNLIHHACIIYTGYIYCSNFCYHVLTEFNTAFGGCGYFNLPIVRSKRQLILKHTLVCTCILGLTLLSTLELWGVLNANIMG